MRSWIVGGMMAVSGGLLFAACSSSDDTGNGGSNINGKDGGGSGGSSGDASVGNGGSGGSVFGGGTSGGGNGTGAGTGTGGGTDDSGLDAPCGHTSLDKTQVNVNILLVVDKSGSMTDPLAGTAPAQSKWDALNDALTTVLTATESDIDYGLDLYPVGANSCSVPSDPALTVPIEDGTTGVPKILNALGTTSPGGSTPTAKALQRALEYYTTGPGATLDGDKYVLLATDGGPNCTTNTSLTCTVEKCTTNIDGKCPIDPTNCCTSTPDQCLDDANTLVKIQALASAGINTFVVGLPGSEAYDTYLNSFADAGGEALSGTTKYYAVTNATDLTTKFQAITTKLITSCRFQLTSDPPQDNLLNVSINGGDFIPQGPDTWQLDTTTSPPTVELLGATCDMVTMGVDSVDIIYGCPTIIIR